MTIGLKKIINKELLEIFNENNLYKNEIELINHDKEYWVKEL